MNILHKLAVPVDIGWTRRHQKLIADWNYSPFTPDIAKLQKYKKQLLFVTDEWMDDRRSSFVLDGLSDCEGVAFTQDHYLFLTKATDGTPIAIPDPDGFKIKGEVHSMEGEAFIKLDKLKLNRVQFIRKRVDLIFPYRDQGTIDNGTFSDDGFLLPDLLAGKKSWIGPEKVCLLEAWMYIGHPDYWMDQIHEQPYMFNQVPTFEPKKDKQWLSEYYKFQNEDR